MSNIQRAIDKQAKLEAEATAGPWDFNTEVEVENDVLLVIHLRNQAKLARAVIEAVYKGEPWERVAWLMETWADHVNGEDV